MATKAQTKTKAEPKVRKPRTKKETTVIEAVKPKKPLGPSKTTLKLMAKYNCKTIEEYRIIRKKTLALRTKNNRAAVIQKIQNRK